MLLLNGSLDHAADVAIGAQEPAFVAKYAFQLAQAFNNFYHTHHILSEADEQKRGFLLGLSGLVEAQLVRALAAGHRNTREDVAAWVIPRKLDRAERNVWLAKKPAGYLDAS